MIPEITTPQGGILLRDESLFSGRADSASLPESVQEVCNIIKYCREAAVPITLRGSLTAMNGAGVPAKGHTMSMERLNQVEYDPETQTIWAQAGATFQKIEQTVRKASGGKREFAAAPTEKTATLGGALSLATSGIRALGHGTMASQVLELEYCDHTGTLCHVGREDEVLHDLLGGEGMYGVITGARLATSAIPAENWGLIFFCDREELACCFADRIRKLPGITALEYLDRGCLTLLKALGRGIPAVTRLPELPGEACAALYVELETPDEAGMEQAAEAILMELDEVGGDPDLSWTAAGEEVDRFRELHHAVQECINLRTAQAHSRDDKVTRLTYPMCAGDDPLARREELAQAELEAVIFGHWDEELPLGIHIFAENAEQYRSAKQIMKRWYEKDRSAGRNVAAHRGIGKVYRDIFCRETKKEIYDPEGLFNPGNQ